MDLTTEGGGCVDSSFWGDIERFISKWTEDTEQKEVLLLGPTRESPAATPPPGVRSDETSQASPDPGADRRSDDHADEPQHQSEGRQAERAQEEPAAPEPPSNPPADLLVNPARASTAAIQTLKMRYIVGKCAGKDLLSSTGQPIIRKGEWITAETVQVAERDGKLVELIVNMVIDGFGD